MCLAGTRGWSADVADLARRDEDRVIDWHRHWQRQCARYGLLLGIGIVSALTMSLALAESRLVAFDWVERQKLMLHLDLDSSTAEIDVFQLEQPLRLVIDLEDTELTERVAREARRNLPESAVVAGWRFGRQSDARLRVVVDLRRPIEARYRRVARRGGQRVLIDFGVPGVRPAAAARGEARADALRDVLVAIDAGHGGRDPGAVGLGQTREKDVVLAVARQLERALLARRGVTPIMIRDDDTYIDLRARMQRARVRRADLFVSIHADAFRRREARGSSVYTLSKDGASSEAAAWLAASENESDALFGEVTLARFDTGVRETLLDLAQGTTLESSLDVGAEVLARLETVGPVHKPTVEQANFAVLKSPDIPSILIETAFISNPDEEQRLNDPRYRAALADALAEGIMAWARRRAPDGTLLAAERQSDG